MSETESERNRLLRRADWRYLLPVAAPTRALCLGGAELRGCCGLIAEQVDDVPQPNVAYDLVVGENPDDASLRVLYQALAPHGACYTEWTSMVPRRAEELRRRLAQAGFRGARTYHPWPSVSRCHAWLPTEGDAARHHWRNAARSTRVRKEKLGHLAGAALARLGMHRRMCAIAFGEAAPREAELVRLARAHGVGTPTGDVMLVTHGERAVGKVVALAFDAGGEPEIAIKTARTPESGHGLAHEAIILDAVQALHPHGMPGVPRVLFGDEAMDAPVVGESALTGVPLAALLRPRSYEGIAERVTTWLSTLAEPALQQAPASAWDRVVEPAFARFVEEFGPVVDAERLERTRAILATIGALPVVFEQRDFSPWNVFDSARGIVVLDWESAEIRGLPALDLIYFCTHAAFYLEGAWVSGRFEAAHRAAWSRGTAIGRVNHACTERYLTQLGLDAELLAPLRLLAWVLHSHSDFVHLRADAGGAPDTTRLRRSRFLRLYDLELDESMSC